MNDYEIINNLEKFSNEELIQFHANAYHTKCMSIGHTKGARNESAMITYAEELGRRGITEIPKREGVFNGDGTS
tara:strand:+ start:1770 stop:1991 length:222 start_codon:yes stop_codon:yes gene_type:complete